MPLAAFCRRAGLPGPPAHPDATGLAEFVGEGTAAVATEFRAAGAGNTSLAARLEAAALPSGYDVQAVPAWGDPDGFYRHDVHAYTPFFWHRDGAAADVPSPTFFSFVDAARPTVYGVPFGAPAYRLHVHPPATAAERHRIDAAMALEAPSPVLDAHHVGADGARAFVAAAGFDAATAADADAADGDTATVFCTTPDPAASAAFRAALARVGARVVRTEVETFVDGSVPQVRLDVRAAAAPPV